ncbi:DUF6682 family protein [Delftia lacustris]|uniref:Uncharacterized protein n=1 Tax=Delftia lacustris TaxID=558537 RepID=A0A1H3QTW0_9BURK|nr:DUF6682 family protein [Delftia lacustris]SDZ16954.1 hypothetical protein SAMN05421547_113148 [Delftia lacustris]
MRVGEFIERFRRAVDDLEAPHFWTDEDVIGYLNEAVQEACERAKLLEDRTTPAVCSITLEPGKSTYALHPSVLEIKRLSLRGRPLHETSVEELDCTHSRWETRQGMPRHFVFEQAAGRGAPHVRFVPEPLEADTVAMTVYRGALNDLPVHACHSEPEIPERYHLRLLDWILHRAYLRQDAEIFNENKAAVSLGLFEQAFGERPDANVQRKHRDKAPPIIRSSW